MSILRFALQAVLVALFGAALVKVVFWQPSAHSESGRSAVQKGGTRPAVGLPPLAFAKGILTLSVDTLRPREHGTWAIGAAHFILHEYAHAADRDSLMLHSCVFAEGLLEALDEQRAKLRLEGRPRRSKLEAYARQRGGAPSLVLVQTHEVARGPADQPLVDCARWQTAAQGVATSAAAVMPTRLRVGASRRIPAGDLVRVERVAGSSADLRRDALGGAWLLVGVHPGRSRFRLERMPGPKAELLDVDVKGASLARADSKPVRLATPREGVFLVPGWLP